MKIYASFYPDARTYFLKLRTGLFPHVWDPPQVHGTQATDTDVQALVKAREKNNCLPPVSCALWEEGELLDFLHFR